MPVLIHIADPQEFFEPIDYHNERRLELAFYSDRRYQDRSRFLSFEELITESKNMFARHPRTKFIAAHFEWHANDLAQASQLLAPSQRLFRRCCRALRLRTPAAAARAFFLKYQDRILFGENGFQPDEYPYYSRTFETADEYFDYYRDYQAFWKFYGLDLPDEVLKKLYSENALK